MFIYTLKRFTVLFSFSRTTTDCFSDPTRFMKKHFGRKLYKLRLNYLCFSIHKINNRNLHYTAVKMQLYSFSGKCSYIVRPSVVFHNPTIPNDHTPRTKGGTSAFFVRAQTRKGYKRLWPTARAIFFVTYTWIHIYLGK